MNPSDLDHLTTYVVEDKQPVGQDADSKLCLGKRCRQQVLPGQKMPTATFSQPFVTIYMCINITIMCTIRNFTTLSPLFASVTAHLTIMTFSFTSWGTT